MERLTAWSDNGMAYLTGVKRNEQEVNSPYPNTLFCILDSFKQLARYEDTGLTPEEVAALAAAKADDRLIVLPCRIADLEKMYELLYKMDMADEAETYTSGYKRGDRNARQQLLGWILQKPDGTRAEAEAALAERQEATQ